MPAALLGDAVIHMGCGGQGIGSEGRVVAVAVDNLCRTAGGGRTGSTRGLWGRGVWVL